MIPKSKLLDTEINIVNKDNTHNTYDITNNKIQGFKNNILALKEAIYKILSTEKYEYKIYSFSYGIDYSNLIGKDIEYVKIELKRKIKECLLSDSRITNVDNFKFVSTGDKLTCSFNVCSIYGEILISKEVTV